MNRNPYEVRLDVLKIAQDMLDKKVTLEQQTYSVSVANGLHVPGGIEPPKMYTEQDLVEKARSLYAFINDKSTGRAD